MCFVHYVYISDHDNLVDSDRGKRQLNKVDDIKHDGRLNTDVVVQLNDSFRQDAHQYKLTTCVVQQTTANKNCHLKHNHRVLSTE